MSTKDVLPRTVPASGVDGAELPSHIASTPTEHERSGNAKDQQQLMQEQLGKARVFSELLANGRTLAYGSVNPDNTQDNQAQACVDRATALVVKLSDETKATAGNKELSGYGQERRLVAPRLQTIIGITDAWIALEAYELEVKQQKTAFYAWPTIDPQNAAEAAVDREIRDWIRSRGGKEAAEVMRQIEQGDNPRIILALLRSPIPMGVPETLALDAWNKQIRNDKPYEADLLDRRVASIEWAETAMKAIAKAGAFLAEYNIKQIVELGEARAKLAKTTRPNVSTDPWELYGIDQIQWKQTARAIEAENNNPALAEAQRRQNAQPV